jgi:hypothetical protein
VVNSHKCGFPATAQSFAPSSACQRWVPSIFGTSIYKSSAYGASPQLIIIYNISRSCTVYQITTTTANLTNYYKGDPAPLASLSPPSPVPVFPSSDNPTGDPAFLAVASAFLPPTSALFRSYRIVHLLSTRTCSPTLTIMIHYSFIIGYRLADQLIPSRSGWHDSSVPDG